MSVTEKEVRHVAKLARLALSDAEIGFFIEGLTAGTVVDAQASALAMAICWRGLSLTAVIELKLRLRDDVVDDGDIRDKVLANAPDAQHGFFAVPKVIE